MHDKKFNVREDVVGGGNEEGRRGMRWYEEGWVRRGLQLGWVGAWGG